MVRPRVHVVAVCLALAASLIGGVLPAAAIETSYRLVDLGGLPNGSGAFALNRAGAAAGYEMLGPVQPHAVLFQGGRIVDLGTLGGDASLASAIGAGGRVVGWARLPDSTMHAFLWSDGAMQDLGTLGGHNSQAFALNASGVVVGSSYDSTNTHYWPFRWTADGGMVRIAIPGVVGGQAYAINDAGTVVGYVIDGVHTIPFAWSPAAYTPLATLSEYGSKAYGIGPGGVIVGYSLTPGIQPFFHAVLWDDAGVHDLGTLEYSTSVAYAVNDHREAVGLAYATRNTQQLEVAAVFDAGEVYDLNRSLPSDTQWWLRAAYGVTDDGVITGVGFVQGVERAFAMVPARLQSPPWGEPTAFAHLGVRAYPSPMRSSGTLELDLPAAARGRVALYDVSGRRVVTIAEGDFARGRIWLDVTPQLGSIGPGVYYARFDGNTGAASQRVVVVR